MLMRRGWLYSGIQCGLASLEPSIEKALIGTGRRVGHAMAELGYIGWFDIDFVVSAKGEIFSTEINARRASPAHVFEIAGRLFGTGWSGVCSAYANDHVQLQGSCHPSYKVVRQAFADFNSAHAESALKAIPTIISSALGRRTPFLGYVLLAPGKVEIGSRAAELEQQIRKSVGMGPDGPQPPIGPIHAQQTTGAANPHRA